MVIKEGTGGNGFRKNLKYSEVGGTEFKFN